MHLHDITYILHRYTSARAAAALMPLDSRDCPESSQDRIPIRNANGLICDHTAACAEQSMVAAAGSVHTLAALGASVRLRLRVSS